MRQHPGFAADRPSVSQIRSRAELVAAPTASLLPNRPALQIVHVFDRSCNLVADNGDIISLVTRGSDLGPFSILATGLAGPMASLRQLLEGDISQRVARADETELRIGPIILDLGPAKVWDPMLVKSYLLGQSIDASIDAIRVVLDADASRDSLLFAFRKGESSVVGSRLRTAWQEIRQAIVYEEPELCTIGAQLAAGVGIGFTPAGDDFLLGILLALWLRTRDATPFADRIVAGAAGRTGRLPMAWIQAAARGEAGLSWHILTKAIQAGDARELSGAASDILGIGQSSGADGLCGFVMAMDAIGGRSDAPSQSRMRQFERTEK